MSSTLLTPRSLGMLVALYELTDAVEPNFGPGGKPGLHCHSHPGQRSHREHNEFGRRPCRFMIPCWSCRALPAVVLRWPWGWR